MLLTSCLDAGDGSGGDDAGTTGLRLRCRSQAHPETWLTLRAIRVEESWSVFSLSQLCTLAPASHATSLEPWPFEWELQRPPDLSVQYMALSREERGARLRYSLPLDCTQDTPPEATSAHSACRVRFVTSPQPPLEMDADVIPG